jgi:hypothetical protein
VLRQHADDLRILGTLQGGEAGLFGALAFFGLALLAGLVLLALKLRALRSQPLVLFRDPFALSPGGGLLLGTDTGVLRFLGLALLAEFFCL